ncbi:MAG: undecaprenyldiphospho-muramoylpentapeptide beta-N-acetylglucosaminyltransferase [Thalassobaculales bacterium]
MSAPLIALAAGGTGGHLFPAKALAEALTRRGHPVALITDRRAEAFDLAGVAVYRVRAEGVTRPGLPAKLRGALALGLGVLDSVQILRRLRPAVVVGFGGYPSLPPTLAAAFLGLPILLHEQNAVLGRANRLVARFARRIATAFAHTRHVEPAKATLVGNPVRPAFLPLRERAYRAPNGGTVSILVTGGSQGAIAFGELVPAALARLPAELRSRLSVVQQTRPETAAAAHAAYAAAGIAAELSPFFADMPERLAAAHLVIGRAGASTIAELAVAGRPAILIPYPHAMDDHQAANAEALVAAGGAFALRQHEATPEALAGIVRSLLEGQGALAAAAAAAHGFARPDAAERLADLAAALAPANGNGDGQPRQEAA